MTKLDHIKHAIEEFKNGKMIVVVDDEDRENEGDFIIAAEKATPDDINFMMKYGRGLVCMPITQACANRLELGPMVPHTNNTALHETNFTISVDAVKNASTGISAADRWETVKVILDGEGEMQQISISDEIMREDKSIIDDLILAAHNNAKADLKIKDNEENSKTADGFGIAGFKWPL